MRPHVLAVLPALNGGGAERVTVNLMSGLAQKGVRVELLTIVHGSRYQDRLHQSISYNSLGAGRLRNSILALVLFVYRKNPLIIYSTFGYINLAILSMRFILRSKVLIWVRDANFPSVNISNSKFQTFTLLTYRYLYKKADLVLCSSKKMQHEVVTVLGVESQSTRILPNPIDEQYIREQSQLGLNVVLHGKLFICAGRLTKQKGFDRIITMFHKLDDIDSRLIILGEGENLSSLQELARCLGVSNRVFFLGFVDNPWSWFAAADALLLGSFWEGMPNVALEALACGLPVIATPDSGAVEELSISAGHVAIKVVEVGPRFIEAMRAVEKRIDKHIAASLLPAEYRADNVYDAFAKLVYSRLANA